MDTAILGICWTKVLGWFGQSLKQTSFLIRGLNVQNLKTILRKSQGSISKLKYFCWTKSILRNYYIQNNKDGIQHQVYKINKESVTHFWRFISVKVKKIVRKSQALNFGKSQEN